MLQLCEISASEFLKFVNNKTADVARSTESAPAPVIVSSAITSFSSFNVLSIDDIIKMIMRAPNKQCSLDPAPMWLIKDCASLLGPLITYICNRSLAEGSMPVSQKAALVTPLLKKPNLDKSDVKNYRPISNLSFLSKLVERCVSVQLTNYLNQNNLIPAHQSAYRSGHSTETALLKIYSDCVDAIDRGEVTLLGMLDMSAAFDTVDHGILLERLEKTQGI